MNQNAPWYKFLGALVLGALLAGCGGAPSSRAPATTDLLLQSGFQAESVKSPAHLQKLPGNQFATVQQPGGTVYVYTDPSSNRLFFGSAAAYRRYRAKAAETGVPEVRQSSQHSMSPSDWEMYGSLHGVGP